MELGKQNIGHPIEDGDQMLVEIFGQTKKQLFDPSFPVINAVSNVICALSFGHQFDFEDENFQKLIQGLGFLVKFSSGFFHVVNHNLD
ncbi:CYP2J2: Cytochrome protein [Crotalus adamanteus]|uniref:CYP2J2: Cytochrome protein n=1 Tax=Crotalus adamanteus TaxID=8729 RepID=A0AAW1BH47_CROAD